MEDTSKEIHKTKLRKATEDFIPDLPPADPIQTLVSNILHFKAITDEWNTKFSKDLMALPKYQFNTEFPRLPNYKNIIEVRQKFDSARLVNSEKLKINSYENATFIFIRVEEIDDIHKVDCSY